MKYYLNKKKFTAFTLVELLVTMSIISILAAMSISAYPKFSEQMALTSETYKILAYFRETQVFGVSALVTPGTKIAYAIRMSKTSNTIDRMIIVNPTDNKNSYYSSDGVVDTTSPSLQIKENFEISEINGILQNSTTSLDTMYSYFKRPNPESRLFGMVGVNIVPGTSLENFSKIEIILRSKKNNVFKKKIVILQTGQMYVSDW
jgi:prepilin-type N-terminal cleavage/methylation domain-containing protein